jgi:hypothetical protein
VDLEETLEIELEGPVNLVFNSLYNIEQALSYMTAAYYWNGGLLRQSIFCLLLLITSLAIKIALADSDFYGNMTSGYTAEGTAHYIAQYCLQVCIWFFA